MKQPGGRPDAASPLRTALRRHQLVRLTAAGWQQLLQLPWVDVSKDCLRHWAAQQLPLVVTRQLPDVREGHVCLGLPAPLQWERRRISLQVPWSSVLYMDDFPAASEVLRVLHKAVRPAAQRLFWQLCQAGAAPRVYGSHGWQLMTGLVYLHSTSDLDLRLQADDAAQADAIVAAMAASGVERPRLDGEVVFPDGSAVAWREWQQWRLQQVDRVLVKDLHGVAMQQGLAWLGELQPC